MSDPEREELLASLALSSVELNTWAWLRLLEHYGSSRAVLDASDVDLAVLKGLSAAARERVAGARARAAEMPAVLDRLTQTGAHACLLADSRYPALLRQIPDPPPLLYVWGDILEQDRFAVAIVGSRSPRPYGVQMARTLAADLGRAGLTVVSGGARGIDGNAHDAVLGAGGRSIAVLGCGIDVAYPTEHKGLFERIAAQGAVVSEYPPGAPPEPWRFPRRNRIISGLARGVIVCDAPEDSGSLITAKCAAEQGRDVFAVPGNVDSGHNRGAHRLLRDGARLVETAEDVLEEFGVEAASKERPASEPPAVEVSPEERSILEMLDLDPVPLDAIIERTGLAPADVAGLLTFLEMKRLVRRVAGPAYVRVLA